MNGWVADYSEARPGAAALKAAGATGLLRYAGALTSSFNITADEVADLHAHGLPVGIFVEQKISAILGGRDAGRALAGAAAASTRAAELPDGLSYLAADDDFTLDGPPTSAQALANMAHIADTGLGFKDVAGVAGLYADFYVIDWMVKNRPGLFDAFIQPEAWSHGSIHAAACLLQRASAPQVVPRDVDYNAILQNNWHPRTIPAPPPPPPSGGGMDPRTLQQNLVTIGWPITVDGNAGPQTASAVREFQNGYWRAGTRLTVDGVAGPQTQAAITRCLSEGGKLSAHFAFREFACSHCGWIKVHGSLPTALEQYRAVLSPGGVGIVSGYRCPAHNAAIGGASNSQHLYGTAADVAPIATLARVRSLGIFSGIEYRRDGLVYHVDTRAQGPDNTTGSSNSNPSIFLWG